MAALEASAEAGKLTERLRRIEMDANRGRVRGRADGADVNDRAMMFERTTSSGGEGVRKVAGRFDGAGEGDVVGEVRGRFERGGERSGGGGVLGKASVFEKGEDGDVRAAEAGVAKAGGADSGSGAVLKKMGTFQREGEEGAKKGFSSIMKTAGAFEKQPGGAADEGVANGGKLLKKAGTFEKQDSKKRKDGSTESSGGGIVGKTGVFERGAKKSEEGLFSKRAALFEKSGDELVKTESVKKEAKQPEVGGSLTEELKEVKLLNKVLVERLVELSGAFKQLERSREELQRRIQRLESK